MTPTVCLNLSNNGLVEVENNSLTRLSQLTTLDLSYNNLTYLPALNNMNGREFWLDISGKTFSFIRKLYIRLLFIGCVNCYHLKKYKIKNVFPIKNVNYFQRYSNFLTK